MTTPALGLSLALAPPGCGHCGGRGVVDYVCRECGHGVVERPCHACDGSGIAAVEEAAETPSGN